MLKGGERIDDLQRNGLRIIQNPSAFCFGMDAVLLASFCRLRKRDVVADMGAGTGILSVLLSDDEPTATFHLFELQQDMADMARRTLELNGLENRAAIHACDMALAKNILGRETVDAVVCNPPYGKKQSTLKSETEGLSLAKHEQDIDIKTVIAACAAIIKNGGRLFMVFPAQRLLELMDALRERRMQPKRVRLVSAKLSKAPYLALVESVKNAREGLKWLPPLIVYKENGDMTDELRSIYHMPKASDMPNYDCEIP